MPLTLCSTCIRVKWSMETSVPISGVNPGLGPTIQESSSWAAAGWGASESVERPAARAAPALRKVRRLGRQSDESMVFSRECDCSQQGRPPRKAAAATESRPSALDDMSLHFFRQEMVDTERNPHSTRLACGSRRRTSETVWIGQRCVFGCDVDVEMSESVKEAGERPM